MADLKKKRSNNEKKIVVRPNGPYRIEGNIPLVRKTQIVSEYGEPLTWEKGETYPTNEPYILCRCGESHRKPFCDGAHNQVDFDGTETAATSPDPKQQAVFDQGVNIVVKRDYSLCSESGFCGTRNTNIDGMVPYTANTDVRSQVMAMIERCPSGSYEYSITKDSPNIEPDLPQQVAETIEITSDGPIRGALWVTGNIPIQRADGQPLETRNRVTLCCCGLSKNKPLCDGTHREAQQKKLAH
jgi:CDGSH-type Zn-finger protein